MKSSSTAIALHFREHFLRITAINYVFSFFGEKVNPRYTFTPIYMGSFACPGIGMQVQGTSVLRLIQRTRQLK
jgi:hypothetical protein